MVPIPHFVTFYIGYALGLYILNYKTQTTVELGEMWMRWNAQLTQVRWTIAIYP